MTGATVVPVVVDSPNSAAGHAPRRSRAEPDDGRLQDDQFDSWYVDASLRWQTHAVHRLGSRCIKETEQASENRQDQMRNFLGPDNGQLSRSGSEAKQRVG
jgi:hypothetical protein